MLGAIGDIVGSSWFRFGKIEFILLKKMLLLRYHFVPIRKKLLSWFETSTSVKAKKLVADTECHRPSQLATSIIPMRLISHRAVTAENPDRANQPRWLVGQMCGTLKHPPY